MYKSKYSGNYVRTYLSYITYKLLLVVPYNSIYYNLNTTCVEGSFMDKCSRLSLHTLCLNNSFKNVRTMIIV